MSYSPMAFNTATAGRAGFVRLGSGIGGQSDGTIVSNATLLGLGTTSNPQFNSLNLGGAYGTTTSTVYLGGANTYLNGNGTTAWFAGSTINFYSGGVTQGTVNVSGIQIKSLGVGQSPSGADGAIAASNITASSINFGGDNLSTFANWTSWTPTVNGIGTGSISSSLYTRIGNLVCFYVILTSDAATNGYFSLPFSSVGGHCGTWIYRTPANPYPNSNGTWQTLNSANVYFSPLTSSTMGPGEQFIFSGTYRV